MYGHTHALAPPHTRGSLYINMHVYTGARVCTHTPLTRGEKLPLVLQYCKLELLIFQDAMFIEILTLLLNNARIQ